MKKFLRKRPLFPLLVIGSILPLMAAGIELNGVKPANVIPNSAEWLHLSELAHTQVDKKTFKKFDPKLKEKMVQETQLFFKEILKDNLSIFHFIDSDFAMLDEDLARHYGIKGVSGQNFRRVALPPSANRGGLLTQSAILLLNSDGKHSNPIKRGVWLLKVILNDSPPSPPAAVDPIDPSDPKLAKLSVKEQLASHRDREACFDCHRKIDPWGLASFTIPAK